MMLIPGYEDTGNGSDRRNNTNTQQQQQQSLEMLFQQCVDDMYTGELSTLHPSSNGGIVLNSSDTASFMDMLAQACEDASEKVQDISYEDVAQQLAEAVAATQKSICDLQNNVNKLLDDPVKMREISQKFDAAGEQIKLLQEDLRLREDAHRTAHYTRAIQRPRQTDALATVSNEDTLRGMLQFADHMCTVLDESLGMVTKDEYELAAQLSLGIATKLLDAGQAMFTSIGDESRRDLPALRGDRSDRITIEELPDDEPRRVSDQKVVVHSAAVKRLRAKREQRKKAQVVRTYLQGVADGTRKQAKVHPIFAAAIGTASLPFIGLAVPAASMAGLALLLEKYYPEHTTLTIEMIENFVQMARLWWLLFKISARQVGTIAKKCIVTWQQHAAQHGYVAASKELVSTGFSLGSLGVSYVYNSIFKTARLTSG